jgi:hypothetical protein
VVHTSNSKDTGDTGCSNSSKLSQRGRKQGKSEEETLEGKNATPSF